MLPFERPVFSKYGAPMGRVTAADYGYELCGKVHLRRVPLYSDYDKGGAYWGLTPGNPLWCAWGILDEAVTYFRAKDRATAKTMLPGCTFYR